MSDTEFSVDLQKLFLEFMIQDAQNYVRVQNIFNPLNFDKSLKKLATFIKEHGDKYSTVPDRAQIRAATGVELQVIEDINEGHVEWFMDEFERFTRRQELERAIIKSADLLENGEYEPVEKMIKDAVQISLTRDLGTDYFSDPKTRLMRIKSNKGQSPTYWPSLDFLLFGGFNRGELQIFCGNPGQGKSLFMQNLACNWILNDLNGAIITLELSEDLTSMRLDSMMAEVNSRDIFRDLDAVELKLKMLAKKSGNLTIKYMPAQSKINDLRAFLKELQIKTGRNIDFVCVDYLDLLMPSTAKVSAENLFIKDKYVSEELRNLAKELNVLMVSASQFNRSGQDEVEFDAANVAGGISKVMTADNVFGIYTSRAMRDRGKYQLQLMKTRSSSGVGKKIELEFNVDTLRISDLGAGEVRDIDTANPTENVLKQIRSQSTVKTSMNLDNNAKKVTGDAQSNKLKSLLANLKKTE